MKTGATTHATHMSGGFIAVDDEVTSATDITFTIPGIDAGMRPGNWMMFAWDSAGVPSLVPIMRVNPEQDSSAAGDANLLKNGTFEVGNTGEGGNPLGQEVAGNSGMIKDVN
ncbi:MAG: galactose oxidase-like domain-containing protein [Pseudomonadota bacterium]